MIPRFFAAAVAACALTAAGALAQTTPAMPATPPGADAAAPLPGANSFTEGEARSRIEGRGFANVSPLKKDDQGIWRGSATKGGAPVSIALDYKGNVVFSQ